jgi:hypothetical protein
VWELIFMLVILKIPVIYLAWVVWWAIKAEPEVGSEGDSTGIEWKPWRRPSGPRPHRGGPHGSPVRRAARRRRRERAET